MSARTLERPETETSRPTNTAAVVRRKPVARAVPELRLEAQIQPIRRRRGVRRVAVDRVLLLTVCYASLAFGSYLACGLGAQVAAESARQSGIKSGLRADAAIRSIHSVENRLDDLAAPGAIEKWARGHGMVRTAPVAQEESRLARLD